MITSLPQQSVETIKQRLKLLYPGHEEQLMQRFFAMLGRYGVNVTPAVSEPLWSERDVVLITYADNVKSGTDACLGTLKRFLDKRVRGLINTVHLLPFYPWSSDDGFSVIDYREVAAEYGRWEDVSAIGEHFTLMFDMVMNHCSAKSEWFQDFVTGIAPARYYFHALAPDTDLSAVVRPRPWPLLTQTTNREGDVWVWTTFSEDQVDLNWANPDVLFEFIDILFLYLSRGVRILRMDAIAFLWKKIGTSCLHLPETHEMVKLFRDITDIVSPETILLTETNVPHLENISYFGEEDEAHMVYQFSLPPLLLHGLLTDNPDFLREWAVSLPDLPESCTYFNFTASHDGIGVRPLQGLIPDDEFDNLLEAVKDRGGKISYKRNPDQSLSPYELNITYLDALSEPEDEELTLARFFCSQTVALSFKGVPAVYFHSLVGTRNFYEGVDASGANRTINRRKWDEQSLENLLNDSQSLQHQVMKRYLKLIKKRREQSAFHPNSEQQILKLSAPFFGFIRFSPVTGQRIVCLYNFSRQPVKVQLKKLFSGYETGSECFDLIRGITYKPGNNNQINFKPYQGLWLVG